MGLTIFQKKVEFPRIQKGADENVELTNNQIAKLKKFILQIMI